MGIDVREKVQINCDGPKCSSYDKETCPATISWVMEDPQKNPDAYLSIPDVAWRMTKVMVGLNGPQHIFLSKQCHRDWLREFTPPLSPKEQASIKAAQPEKPPEIAIPDDTKQYQKLKEKKNETVSNGNSELQDAAPSTAGSSEISSQS